MGLTFYNGDDYLALPREPQPWIIKPLIPVAGAVNIYGKAKSRKSWAMLGMALAIANGEAHWNGFEVKKSGPVAYLQIDTPREEWAGNRLDRLKRAGYNVKNLHVADMYTVPYPFNILEEPTYLAFKQRMAELKPVVVVIDTLRESFSGDENDSNVMRNVVSNLAAACRWPEGKAAMVLISHARKDGIMQTNGGADLMDDNRGSSYVPGRMDVIIRMTPHTFAYKGRATGQKSHVILPEVEGEELGAMVILEGQEDKLKLFEEARKLIADTSITNKSYRHIADLLVEQGHTKFKSGTIREWPEFRALFHK